MNDVQLTLLKFYDVFAFIGVSSVLAISLIAFSLIGWSFKAKEHGFVVLTLIIAGIILFFDPSIKSINIEDIFNIQNLLIAIAYVGLGVIWSFYKWFNFIKEQVVNFNSYVKTFLKKDQKRIDQVNKDYADIISDLSNYENVDEMHPSLARDLKHSALSMIAKVRHDESSYVFSAFSSSFEDVGIKKILANGEIDQDYGSLRKVFDSNMLDSYIHKMNPSASLITLKESKDLRDFAQFKFEPLDNVFDAVRKNIVIAAKNHIERISIWIFWWPFSVCSFIFYDFFAKIKEFVITFFSGVYAKISNKLINDKSL